MKKLIKNLDAARGNGTSMISLVMKPGVSALMFSFSVVKRPRPKFIPALLPHHHSTMQSAISDSQAMLTHEYGTASNIKSRVNRLSVLSAISSAQARLKLYNRGESCFLL